MVQRRSRRERVAGAVHGDELARLARELTKCRARAGRLWRRYQVIDDQLDPGAATLAHQAWSECVDASLGIVDSISGQPAHTPADLFIQFEAIWWWIVEDDSILDVGTKRWVVRFRRSLRRLAAGR